MKFSKKIIDSIKKDANVFFATTNYHVFRSGVFATEVGLKAKGIGAKTKWYFWPNATIREFIALIVSSRKLQIMVLIMLTIIAALSLNAGAMIAAFMK